eukprot:TRINITY_DN22547_c0_g1_i1.p1 TRINITY_DN22547_c0_g1~~TRINITY_DN22547_c0_g1_i1.p1  ORF type:complete len:170 (+),score=36.19 TRINITY_DN22547_c0_g1_i1:2-511(+)
MGVGQDVAKLATKLMGLISLKLNKELEKNTGLTLDKIKLAKEKLKKKKELQNMECYNGNDSVVDCPLPIAKTYFAFSLRQDSRLNDNSWDLTSNTWLSFPSATDVVLKCVLDRCCSLDCALNLATSKDLFNAKQQIHTYKEGKYEVELTDLKYVKDLEEGQFWDTTAYD